MIFISCRETKKEETEGRTETEEVSSIKEEEVEGEKTENENETSGRNRYTICRRITKIQLGIRVPTY